MTLASLSGWLNLARARVTEDTVRAILNDFCKKNHVFTQHCMLKACLQRIDHKKSSFQPSFNAVDWVRWQN